MTEEAPKPIENKVEESFGLSEELKANLIDAIASDQKPKIQTLLIDASAPDIAEFISQISAEERQVIIESIKKHFNPEILVHLESEVKDHVIELLGSESSGLALGKLDIDETVHVIEDLETEDQAEILEAIPDEGYRAEVAEGLSYPENSAGRLMQKSFVSVPDYWNVGQVIDYLRIARDVPDKFYEVFVTDEKGKPVGSILSSRFLRAQRSILVKDILRRKNFIAINVDTDQEDAAFLFRKYTLISAPVVNSYGVMIGVITVNDIVDVMEEEAEEDIMRMGGISETDLYSAFHQTLKHRFPWLFINFITAITASVVVGIFEETISKIVVLAVLMPMVASMGGNGGIQTSTLIVRAIATRELTDENALRVILKEFFVGFLNGAGFALIAAFGAWIVYHDIMVSLIFGAAMMGNLIVGGLFGALIPYLLYRKGFDPASSAGIILTTFTDIAGFLIFLGLATIMLV